MTGNSDEGFTHEGTPDEGEVPPRLSSDPDPDPDADPLPDPAPGLGTPEEHPDPPDDVR